MGKVIGRSREREIFRGIINSEKPELVVMYGRRRIGKTFLIDQEVTNNLVFKISGLHHGNQKDQLENFTHQLSRFSKLTEATIPSSWLAAFNSLELYLNSLRKSKKKKVLFFDEFPWMATRKSRFLIAFENFWNTYASQRDDLAIIICGSAASWMIEKVVKNKGGLHNRITQLIRLTPFNLCEVELFLKSRNIKLNRYDIVKLYMVTGGVPFYLNGIKRGRSVPQIIDDLCFHKNGLLHREFDELFSSLFEHEKRHIQIVKSLSNVRKGLTRNDLLDQIEMSSGGGFTRTLNELVESGFITNYHPYNQRSKQTLYRLTDFFTMFYMKYMYKSKSIGPGTWMKKSRGQSYQSWSGFTFETVCLEHIPQIKNGLGLQVIYTEASSWKSKGKKTDGAQIDLLIDRDDNVINICEIKFSKSIFTIDKKYASQLRNKIEVFRSSTKTKKNLYLTIITIMGLQENEYTLELVQNELTIDALFLSIPNQIKGTWVR